MKRNRSRLFLIPGILLTALSGCLLLTKGLQAATDIDIDAYTSAVAAPTAVGTVISQDMSAKPTVAPTNTAINSEKALTGSVEPVASPAPQVAQGILQMRGVYQAGIDCYRKQDFAKAIRYLKKSLEIHDPYTPKFYYAEANAMLGVIYQFNIIDKPQAYEYYRAALKVDPSTKTAKKHIHEVSAAQTK